MVRRHGRTDPAPVAVVGRAGLQKPEGCRDGKLRLRAVRLLRRLLLDLSQRAHRQRWAGCAGHRAGGPARGRDGLLVRAGRILGGAHAAETTLDGAACGSALRSGAYRVAQGLGLHRIPVAQRRIPHRPRIRRPDPGNAGVSGRHVPGGTDDGMAGRRMPVCLAQRAKHGNAGIGPVPAAWRRRGAGADFASCTGWPLAGPTAREARAGRHSPGEEVAG